MQSDSENCRTETCFTSLHILIGEMNVCGRVAALKLSFSPIQGSIVLAWRPQTACLLTGVTTSNKQRDSLFLFVTYRIRTEWQKHDVCHHVFHIYLPTEVMCSGLYTIFILSSVAVCFLEGLIHVRKKYIYQFQSLFIYFLFSIKNL